MSPCHRIFPCGLEISHLSTVVAFSVHIFCTFFNSILINWMEESEVSASTVIHIREMSVSHGAKV